MSLVGEKIKHQSPMQTEKSQPSGQQIMPEMRFTEFPALSVDPRVGIFPFNLRLEFLSLHRRLMIDSLYLCISTKVFSVIQVRWGGGGVELNS